MTTLKSFIVFGLILLSSSLMSFGQCNANLDYSYSKDSTNGTYTLSLKSSEIVNNVKVQLYDLNLGKVVSEKIVSIITNENVAVFTNVSSSVYAINFKLEQCDRLKSLGGLYGIELK